jgi:hypothetical protein
MSLYPPPENNSPIFNPSTYIASQTQLNISTADARYLKLSGGIESGLVTFNSGLTSVGGVNITNSSASTSSTTGALIVSGGIATAANSYFGGNLVLDGTNKSIYNQNGSAANPSFSFFSDQTTGIYRIGAGNIGWACSGVRYADLNSTRLSLVGNLSFENSGFSNSISSDVLTSSKTILIPNYSGNVLIDGGNQSVYNKNIQYSSPTTIASISVGTGTMTTSKNHGLLTGDTIKFPIISTITGIAANTIYTISATPSATQMSLTGITFGGTVGSAYYIIVSRSDSNIATPGGLVQFYDPANGSFPIQFDTSSALGPIVMRFPLTATAVPLSFPAGGGTIPATSTTQTWTAAQTLSGGIINTRAGQTTVAGAGIYSNPATVAMSAANSYFWNYFNTPLSTGATTGTAANVVIAGATTTATNNYALQILAGQSSINSGAVATPSIVFGTSNTSGFYSSAANNINCSISGVNLFGVSSTGITTTGSVFTATVRPTSGNQTLLCPNVNAAAGTSQLLISPTNTVWSAGGVAELDLGDNNHYIKVTNGAGMEIQSFNNVKLGTQGSPLKNFRYGTTTYAVSLAAGANATVSVVFGVTLVSVPTIVVSLTTVSGGSVWERCNVGASAVTTTGFDATILNPTASATAGSVLISYVAMNL